MGELDMKFEFEEFSNVEDVFLYLVSIAPPMKQVLPVSSYKGYVFSVVPLTPLSGDVLMMVYTKARLDPGMVEFDISTKKYKNVSSVERADKNYFIVLTPTRASLADSAIEYLDSINSEQKAM
ncbi:MAG: hypothetical protein ACJ72T_10560 [Nitrososphaeraceae archaeon]